MSPEFATTLAGLIGALAVMVKFFMPETMGPMIDSIAEALIAIAIFLIGYFSNKTNEQMPRFMRKG